MNINYEVNRLINFAVQNNLIDELDAVYASNLLLEVLNLDEFEEVEVDEKLQTATPILENMLDYAVEKGMIEDTTTERDLFDTKIMNALMPRPSEVIKTFNEKYKNNKEEATDYYYKMSIASNYIRKDRTDKNIVWKTPTEYGDLDITINLSKPEKDPRDIAKAKLMKSTSYPKCLLCKQNEGFRGNINHPARQNHRIIPMEFAGENWFLQYSPYVYYNEHCIILNAKHTPMKIYRKTFENLLGFVEKLPHYFAGSNADLPIVGGSILSHDHFQGGAYTFAMAKAPYEYKFNVTKYEGVTIGIVKWPMSVIRLQSESKESIVELSSGILDSWRAYTDQEAFVYSETDGVPHNTITPIARMNGSLYEMDLVLRNNITTEEKPWGVYHPDEKLHHIKKENIGLIEVMGLAVLPARLKKEMEELADAIIAGKDIRAIDNISKHAEWVDEWYANYEITSDNIKEVLHIEIAKRFVQVLECAGVFKRTEKGMEQFKRFLSVL